MLSAFVGLFLAGMSGGVRTPAPPSPARATTAAEHASIDVGVAATDARATPSPHESRRRSALGSASLLTVNVPALGIAVAGPLVHGARVDSSSISAVTRGYDATAPPRRLI